MSTKNIHNTKNTERFQEKEKSYNNSNSLVKIAFFGVGITNETEENILEFVIKSIEEKENPYYIVTPNPEMIVLANKNPEFKTVLNNARIASNDGVGLGIAAKILGKKLVSRTTGVDLMVDLCRRVEDWPITVSFLGGRGGVAEKTYDCLKKKYPGLKLGFANSQLPQRTFPQTDILFVAYGAPKQELWMADHVGKIPVRVMIGVGGAFDYISGNVSRAPKLIRSFGFEWLFRLVIQPWRWKRQLALFSFGWMVLKKRMSLSFSPLFHYLWPHSW